MSFESFYGGRMGASFVIVKQFDGINIPQVEGSRVYKAKYLAITNDEQYYVYDTDHFIIRNEDNYKDYLWKLTSLDGSTVDTKPDKEGTGVVSQQVLDIVLAEGMVQCFEQGGDTTNEVNYGEYVIIDTPDKNNPNNGKVYRRGMNFDYNATTNPLAGAEYIGQIVGPQGETPELDFDHYEDIINAGGAYHLGEYDEVNEDLVPGSYIDESGVRQFNDKIKYVYTTIKDEFGNIKGCVVGFKLPTLVQDFEAQSMKPYEQRVINPETGEYYNYDLISEDLTEYIDNKWKHPFYQKWQIKIPHGYHGINSTNIEIVHTKTMPEGYKEDFAGTAVYNDIECTIPHVEAGSPLILTDSVDVLKELEDIIYLSTDEPIYNADNDVLSCSIDYNGQTLYVKKEDCYMDVVRYRETNFDNLEDGEITYHYIGGYNEIQRITLSDDGTLTVFYSMKENPQELEELLRWIDTQSSSGIVIDGDGSIHVYYNTVHDPVGTDIDPYERIDVKGRAHDHQDYSNVLTWITDISLNQQGDFVILYNNDKIEPNGRYYESLEWIDYVTVDTDGTMTFYYNNNHNNPAYQFTNLIKIIDKVEVQTENPAGAGEGTGDQKLRITYNTGIIEVVQSNPLNYIIETVICRPSLTYPNAPYSHLLVYYADPALRQTLQTKWVTYPSEKYPGTIWTEWVDLGDVRGAPGGLHILEDVDSLTDLQDISGDWIPPEQLTDSSGIIINPEGAGWAVTYTPTGSATSYIYCYDYNSKIWYPIGSIDPTSADPRSIIIKSTPVGDTYEPDPTDVAMLKEYGFWLAQEVGYYAN